MADCAGLKAELDALDAKILALLSSVPTSGNFDWSVGHVRIDNGSRVSSLKQLQEYRESLWKMIQLRCPCEVVEDVGHNINKFGNADGCEPQ